MKIEEKNRFLDKKKSLYIFASLFKVLIAYQLCFYLIILANRAIKSLVIEKKI